MGTVRPLPFNPVRIYEKNAHGVLAHARLKIDRLWYSGPLFENEGDAIDCLREHGKPDCDYVILTVQPR